MGRRRFPSPPLVGRVEGLDERGRGIVRVGGRSVHVAGALAGEEVEFEIRRRVRGIDEGITLAVREPSPARVVPRCRHCDVCGGCSLQPLAPEAQVAAKEQILLGHLERAEVDLPAALAPPLTGSPWRYRRRARLGVRHVPAKGGALVGFREHCSHYLAVITRCEVLADPAGSRIEDLGRLISGLDARARIPQVEVAIGENAAAVVFRHLDPLSDPDRMRLREFAEACRLQVFVQPGGPDSVAPLHPARPETLRYTLPEPRVTLWFEPTDFIQINAAVNRRLVGRVLSWLDPGPGDRVADLFCGIGNFSLPVARAGASVVGFEGDPRLAARAAGNAARNDLAGARFHAADLTDPERVDACLAPGWDKILLDPPRSGAATVVEHLAAPYPSRVVYVSCNAQTLARDARILCRDHGYRLARAGVVDMFPHTAHAEAVAGFDRRV